MKNANPVFRPVPGSRAAQRGPVWRRPVARVMALWALSGIGLAGCAREEAAAMLKKAATTSVKTVADYFPIGVGDRVVRMQLAVRADEMQRGLMERRDLGRDQGMIFIYDKSQQMSFWMRNTPTPLDIGFFSPEGVLEEVYPLYPFDETAVSSRGRELRFALEVNQGWFRENGVKPGAKLDLKALAEALRERGFDPRKYGLDETPARRTR